MNKKAISVTESAEAGGAQVISGFPVIPTVSSPTALAIRRKRAPVTVSEAEGDYSDAISAGASEAASQLSRKFGEGFLYELEKASASEKEAVFSWLMGGDRVVKKVVAEPALQAAIKRNKIRAESFKPTALSAPIHSTEGRGPVPTETDIWGSGREQIKIDAKSKKTRQLGIEGKPEIRPL